MSNIFDEIPDHLPDEIFTPLLEGAGPFQLERIVSKGQASPEGEWYDQDIDEWVILLKGSAGIRLEGVDDTVVLIQGNYLHLPAHRRHRVEWTDPNTETVWLALHYKSAKSGS